MCILILYSTTLLNSLLSFDSFLVESLGFSVFKIISSSTKDNFNSSFPIWKPFISFSWLIVLTRTSKTMLIKNDHSGHTCLLLILKEKAYNLSPMSKILAVGLSYMVFIMLRCIPSISNLWRKIKLEASYILISNYTINTKL